MAYYFYLDKLLLPIAPEKMQIVTGNENKTITLINGDEINVLKKSSLTEIEFEILLPNTKYPFAIYKNGFKMAEYYLEKLEKLKMERKPFWFKVTRKFPDGSLLFGTNMKTSLEQYTIKEDAKYGFDVTVSVKLKEYRDYGMKKYKITKELGSLSVKKSRSSENAPKAKKYIVKKGDTLWMIARKCYGDGAKYKKIESANKDKIKNPSLIYPGQVFIIP